MRTKKDLAAAAAAQAPDSFCHQLISLLTQAYSTLAPFLRTSDLFMLRRTCSYAWMSLRHPVLTKASVVRAAVADGGHLPMLRWCNEVGAVLQDDDGRNLGESCGEELIWDGFMVGEWAHYHSMWWPLLEGAARGRRASLARRLFGVWKKVFRLRFNASDPADPLRKLMRLAAENTLEDLLEMLLAVPEDWWRDDMYREASLGNETFIKWYFTRCQGTALQKDANVICYAAEAGSVPFLTWLLDNGMTIGAAKSGSLELLEWMEERGIEFQDDAICGAVEEGQREVTVWLVARP